MRGSRVTLNFECVFVLETERVSFVMDRQKLAREAGRQVICYLNSQIAHAVPVTLLFGTDDLPTVASIISEVLEAAEQWIDPMVEKPPMRRFVSGQGWQPAKLPYVLAVDIKGRMSVGYASEHSGYDRGYSWTFAKPIGEVVRWMHLPSLPKMANVIS